MEMRVAEAMYERARAVVSRQSMDNVGMRPWEKVEAHIAELYVEQARAAIDELRVPSASMLDAASPPVGRS
jgi:hypothetical protein